MSISKSKTITIGLIFALALLITGCSEKGGDFVPLFDGASLDGWVIPEKARPSWKAEDGVLLNDGVDPDCGSLIWTEREDYKDFILKVDWRLSGEPREHLHPVYDYNGNRIRINENGPAP